MAEPASPTPTNDDTAAFVAAVCKSVAAADAGRTAPCEAVRRWLLSCGTGAELPPSPVTFMAPAFADLLRLRTYIEQENPIAANRAAVQPARKGLTKIIKRHWITGTPDERS